MERERITPPYEMNYNWGSDVDGYKSGFAKVEAEVYFPFVLKFARERFELDKVSFLDVGCGLGPMAYAFCVSTKDLPGSSYLGIDIRKDAIDWLASAYGDMDNVQFLHHATKESVDYIPNAETVGTSSGDEADYAIPERTFNIQWSSSLFTHLTPQACVRALKSIARAMVPGGLSVNTWLIIDDNSVQSLAMGVADRQLPIDYGEFLSYSAHNPLMCTAYKSPSIARFYEEAGLKIVGFLPGSWRGQGITNGITYQDIILSELR